MTQQQHQSCQQQEGHGSSRSSSGRVGQRSSRATGSLLADRVDMFVVLVCSASGEQAECLSAVIYLTTITLSADCWNGPQSVDQHRVKLDSRSVTAYGFRIMCDLNAGPDLLALARAAARFAMERS
jgi:hypothetical protein